MQESYDIAPLEEVYVADDELQVPVSVEMYEEEYMGSSRDEEYVERHSMGSEMMEVSCPLQFMYVERPDGTVEEWDGADAIDKVSSTSWDDVSVVDVETVEFTLDGTVFIASYDASGLDEYRE